MSLVCGGAPVEGDQSNTASFSSLLRDDELIVSSGRGGGGEMATGSSQERSH